MKKEAIISLLSEYPKQDVEKFASYCTRLFLEKDKKTGALKNTFMKSRTEQDMATLFERVYSEGLVFDGIHITLQQTGVSYDYIAYKNKMLIAYPESQIDVSLVYQGDTISFSKDSGKVKYSHKISDPFSRKEEDIIGAYAVIKNKRGEFLNTLNKEELQKHRDVAKTDYIWKQWFSEMCMKTVIKKACKQHFTDIYTVIEEMDNKNYNIGTEVYRKKEFKELAEAYNEGGIEYGESMRDEQEKIYRIPFDKVEKLMEVYSKNQSISDEDINSIWKDVEAIQKEARG